MTAWSHKSPPEASPIIPAEPNFGDLRRREPQFWGPNSHGASKGGEILGSRRV